MTMVTHAAPRRCHTPITGHRGHAAAARGGRRRRSAGRKRATLSRRSTSPAVHGSATIGLSINLVSSSFRCFFRSSERRCLPLPSASEAIKLQGRAAELDVDAFPPALGRWRSSRHAHNSRVRSGRDDRRPQQSSRRRPSLRPAQQPRSPLGMPTPAASSPTDGSSLSVLKTHPHLLTRRVRVPHKGPEHEVLKTTSSSPHAASASTPQRTRAQGAAADPPPAAPRARGCC